MLGKNDKLKTNRKKKVVKSWNGTPLSSFSCCFFTRNCTWYTFVVGDCFNGNKGGVMVDIHLLFGTLTFLLKWVLSPNMLGLLSILPHKRSFLFVLSTWDCIIQNKFMKLPLHVLVTPYYMFLVQIHTYLHNTHIWLV